MGKDVLLASVCVQLARRVALLMTAEEAIDYIGCKCEGHALVLYALFIKD